MVNACTRGSNLISFQLNGKPVEVDVDPTTPLLWVIRDHLNLTGTKFGCGMAQCGACTVHIDGVATRSCVMPIAGMQGKKIETIEGIDDKVAKTVQETWLEENVVQCGYCQSGQIMSAVALLRTNQKPSDEQIDGAMSGNICRCATYVRIRHAIHSASAKLEKA
jgi:isoquinoline 1-oxidoreductase subunit alpha